MIEKGEDFTWNSAFYWLNIKLLKKAKEKGYFLRYIYVLTSDYKINIARLSMMESMGGHGVPEEKIKSGYYKALDLISELVEICDIVHIYDNTNVPFRIFKKRKILELFRYWKTHWN